MVHALLPAPRILILISLGLFLPPVVNADIYTWTDANGVKHFSNKPPRNEVVATRHSEEIPYDAEADRKNAEADRRYFEQRAMESKLRRLERTERALKESLDRARAAEGRADEQMQTFYEDEPYDWGTYYGGDYGGYYNVYDRRGERYRDRRKRRHHRRLEERYGDRSKGERHVRAPLDERTRRREHIRRHRRSKRERGVTSGLTRVVPHVPSPYYMGYRPVYSRDRFHKSRRGGHGRRVYHHGRGSYRSGGRARISF